LNVCQRQQLHVFGVESVPPVLAVFGPCFIDQM
jgi:hypothetical protein